MSWRSSHRKEYYDPLISLNWCIADNDLSITFSYGGIRIDDNGHALTSDNVIIPGLSVAGVDAGGFSNVGYAGGLALAFVTGFWAAREVARSLGLPEPRLPSVGLQDRDLVAKSPM